MQIYRFGAKSKTWFYYFTRVELKLNKF